MLGIRSSDRKIRVLAAFQAAALGLSGMVAGCGDEAAGGAAVDAKPAQIVEPSGKKWLKVGPAKIDPNGPPIRKAPFSPGRDIVAELSVEELAKKVRPEMEADGVEYLLSEEDALELARAMKAMHGKEQQTEGFIPEGMAVATELEGRVRGIFDGESRTPVTSNAFPWNTIAVISGGVGGSCTGFKLINHHTIVTAAHCLKDNNDNWRPKPNITFAAGTVGPGLTMPGSCYNRTVPASWNSDADVDVDYGIIRLRGNGANCDPAAYMWTGFMGTQTIGSCTTTIGLNSAGYPVKNPDWGAPPPGSWTYPTMFEDYRGNAWTSCPTYPSAVWHENDFSPGMSGGPLWRFDSSTGNRFVRAIQIAAQDGPFQNTNRGLRFTSGVLTFLTENAGS